MGVRSRLRLSCFRSLTHRFVKFILRKTRIHEATNTGDVVDYTKTVITLVVTAVRNPSVLVIAVWPYGVLVGLFGAFIAWNGGVVLGDKSNHVATIHLPQLLYIWPYIFFFSAPLLYPYLIQILWPIVPSSLRRFSQRMPGVHGVGTRSPHWFTIVVSLGAFSLFASIIVHFNTIVHPFTLADNRHYVFYVFRILRRPYVKYLVTPVYGICAWCCIQALDRRASQLVDRDGGTETETATSSEPEGCKTSFVIIWLVTCTLTLCSAPLVEPRYFILPWTMWRLHLPLQLPQREPRISKKELRRSKDGSGGGAPSMVKRLYLGYDPQLSIETLWFLIVNAVTGYVFLYRGFEWAQEPGRLQRFMW